MTIEDLTPEQRVEIQNFWLLKDRKRRDFLASGQPERRGKKRGNNWLKVWHVNNAQRRWERLGGSLV